MSHSLDKLTGVYPVQKTLRFRLLPQGKTSENFRKKQILERDSRKHSLYPALKELCDDFYRDLITKQLEGLELEWQDLADAYASEDEEYLEEQQDRYRNLIAACLSQTQPEALYKNIFKAALINTELPSYLKKKNYPPEKDDLYRESLREYAKFTSALTNYWSTRENIFTDKAIVTSVAYRLVHVNFPIFLQNLEAVKTHRAYLQISLEALEKQLGSKMSDFSEINDFNRLAVQKGIDNYNTLIGGFFSSEREKLQGYNEKLNLFLQQENSARRVDGEDRLRLPRLQQLQKQILCEASSRSFVLESIIDDNDLLDRLNTYHSFIMGENRDLTAIYHQLKTELAAANLNELWIEARNVAKLSHLLCGDWRRLSLGLIEMAEQREERLLSFKEAVEEERDWSRLKQKIHLSFAELQEALDRTAQDDSEQILLLNLFENMEETVFENLDEQFREIVDLQSGTVLGNSQSIKLIKKYFDTQLKVLDIWNLIRRPEQGSSDASFYSLFATFIDRFEQTVHLYNMARNYLSQKPDHSKKFKLNFNNPTLASGWSESKIQDNSAFLLRRNGQYFLAILERGTKFKEIVNAKMKNTENQAFEWLQYHCQPNAFKMIPKCSTALKEVCAHFNDAAQQEDYILSGKKYLPELRIRREIYEIQEGTRIDEKDKLVKRYQTEYLRRTGDQKGYNEALEKWIGFCLDFLHCYEGSRDFDLSKIRKPRDYGQLDEFYRDVDAACFDMRFIPLRAGVIEDFVEAGKLYLFQIYNKDYAENASGKKNLHTLLWEALFSEENIKEKLLLLNGGAELFFRPRQIADPIVHPKNSILLNRFDKDGNALSPKVYHELYSYLNQRLTRDELSEETQAKLDEETYVSFPTYIDRIKDRRYTEDQTFFHVPITINWTKKNMGTKDFNTLVRSLLSTEEKVNIIGIDRGERNLLYYSVLDQSGRIIEQGSLNDLVQQSQDHKHVIPYQALLRNREIARQEARKSWQSIDAIKELKEGYLSHAIYVLCQLIIKNNAIVVMEDLNYGFKRGRFKVEKQVYQKFETALIRKLSNLSFKDINSDQPGGILRPFQLCYPVTALKEVGKQNGRIFYVPAAYTSVLDPLTGFANLFNMAKVKARNRQDFLSKLESCRYDEETDSFAFQFDYHKMGAYCRASKTGRSKWTVYTRGERYCYDSKLRNTVVKQPTEILRESLLKEGIEFTSGRELLPDILKNAVLSSRTFESFKIALQLRNSKGEEDFILSPVKNAVGGFFDSRTADPSLPQDADANGAYNIARKGLLYLEQIKQGKSKLSVSFDEWMQFATKGL